MSPWQVSSEAFTRLVARQVADFRDCRLAVRSANNNAGAAATMTPATAVTTTWATATGAAAATATQKQPVDEVWECMYHRRSRCKSVRNGCIRLAYGIYSRPLAHWWSIFPKASLLVLRSEELKADVSVARAIYL